MKTVFRRTAALILLIVIAASCAPKAKPLGLFGASRKADVLGQDGVTSIPFSETLTLWTFGDTLLGTWKGGVSTAATFEESANLESMVSNSLAFSERPTPGNVEKLRFIFYKRAGKVAPFIHHLPGESPKTHRLWAADGIRLGGRVYVYYMIVRTPEQGNPFSFKLAAIGLARWDVPASWKPGDEVGFRRLPDLFRGEVPAFGAGVLERGGYIYTVGHQPAKDGTSPVKIARVRKDAIADGRSYEFLSARGQWVKDLPAAGGFLGDVMGECSISYNEALAEYVMVYCRTWTGEIAMVRFRDFAALPDAKKEIVYRPPALPLKDGKAQAWYYSGKEIFSWERSIYAIYIHPLEYQPYLLRIDLR